MRKPLRVSPTLQAFLPRHSIVMGRVRAVSGAGEATPGAVASDSASAQASTSAPARVIVPQPRLLIVDLKSSAEPFAGAAGQLLGKMLEAMGLAMSDVALVSAGGESSFQSSFVLFFGDSRAELVDLSGRRAMTTFHPEILLSNPAAKKEAWNDLQILAREMGLKIPKKSTTTKGGA